MTFDAPPLVFTSKLSKSGALPTNTGDPGFVSLKVELMLVLSMIPMILRERMSRNWEDREDMESREDILILVRRWIDILADIFVKRDILGV